MSRFSLQFIRWGILFFVASIFFFELYISSSVRMQLDTALLHYVAFLWDRYDLAIYKDIFETSMPFSFIFHITLGKLFGYVTIDNYFGLINIAYLGAIFLMTYLIMREFDRYSAFFAIFLFGLLYFRNGPELVLQRDYLTILPIAISIYLASLNISRFKSSIFIGLLFGVVFSIKPHLGIGLPFIIIYMILNTQKDSEGYLKLFLEIIKYGLLSLVALIFILLLETVWLYSMDSISSFWFLFSQYLPLHIDLGNSYEMVENRVEYSVKAYFSLLGFLEYPYHKTILLLMLFAIYFTIFKVELTIRQKRLFWLLLVLMLFYSFIVGLGGKFWGYHWIVFTYFVALLSSLILFNSKIDIKYEKIRLSVLSLFLILTIFNIGSFKHLLYTYTYGKYGLYPKDGMVDEVALFLKENLKDGETVQPIDWSTGSIHSMLLSESKLATKYMYDYHFYHHTNLDINKKLREDFINQLKDAKPKYLIDVKWDYKAYPTGKNSSIEFKELDEFKKDYHLVKEGVMYEILERNISKTD